MATQTKLNALVQHAFRQQAQLLKESEEWGEVAEQLLTLYLENEAQDDHQD